MSLVFCFQFINEPAYRQAGLFSPRACNVKFGKCIEGYGIVYIPFYSFCLKQ